MSEHKYIWLQPECCADPDEGRHWCKDPDPVIEVFEVEPPQEGSHVKIGLLDWLSIKQSGKEAAEKIAQLTTELSATKAALAGAETLWHEENSALKAELDAATSKINTAALLTRNAPELNMNNYNHDDVDRLNNMMIEIYLLLNDKQQPPTNAEGCDG